MTQPAFAKALGISDKLVDYYERRATNPALEFVKKVAKFFDVSTTYFTADELPTKSKPGPKSRIETRLAEIKKLPPKQQEVVLLFLDSFLERVKKKVS